MTCIASLICITSILRTQTKYALTRGHLQKSQTTLARGTGAIRATVASQTC